MSSDSTGTGGAASPYRPPCLSAPYTRKRSLNRSPAYTLRRVSQLLSSSGPLPKAASSTHCVSRKPFAWSDSVMPPPRSIALSWHQSVSQGGSRQSASWGRIKKPGLPGEPPAPNTGVPGAVTRRAEGPEANPEPGGATLRRGMFSASCGMGSAFPACCAAAGSVRSASAAPPSKSFQNVMFGVRTRSRLPKQQLKWWEPCWFGTENSTAPARCARGRGLTPRITQCARDGEGSPGRSRPRPSRRGPPGSRSDCSGCSGGTRSRPERTGYARPSVGDGG